MPATWLAVVGLHLPAAAGYLGGEQAIAAIYNQEWGAASGTHCKGYTKDIKGFGIPLNSKAWPCPFPFTMAPPHCGTRPSRLRPPLPSLPVSTADMAPAIPNNSRIIVAVW